VKMEMFSDHAPVMVSGCLHICWSRGPSVRSQPRIQHLQYLSFPWKCKTCQSFQEIHLLSGRN